MVSERRFGQEEAREGFHEKQRIVRRDLGSIGAGD
jgi:hypothetical protein